MASIIEVLLLRRLLSTKLLDTPIHRAALSLAPAAIYRLHQMLPIALAENSSGRR